MTGAVVIGAGPAGLMAAQRLAEAGHAATVVDAMPSPARKFLLAGRGGLNLTHSEPLDAFLSRYRSARPYLEPFIRRFPPDALRDWCQDLGEETFAGSSGRVFPRSFKTSPLLRAWLRRLDDMGVTLRTGARWCGFSGDGALVFATAQGELTLRADAVVLALGGASWPRLGSTGAWTAILRSKGVDVTELRPSNCGFAVAWSEHIRERHAGAPLKRIALSFGSETARGEAIVTAEGLEGGAVYALSGPLREAVHAKGGATATLDLRPDISAASLAGRLSAGRKRDSLGNRLRKQAGLSPAAIAVFRDLTPGFASLDPAGLALAIKAAPLPISAVRPIDRAISSAGGVRWDELDADLMLRKLPGVFCAGEMIDWEAPTGGYLLQACFATGAAAGEGAARRLQTLRPTACAGG